MQSLVVFAGEYLFFTIIKAGASIYLLLLAFCCSNEIPKRTVVVGLVVWGHGEKGHRSRRAPGTRTEEKKRKGPGVSQSPMAHTPNNLSMVLPPVNSVAPRTKPFTHGLLGTLEIHRAGITPVLLLFRALSYF